MVVISLQAGIQCPPPPPGKGHTIMLGLVAKGQEWGVTGYGPVVHG